MSGASRNPIEQLEKYNKAKKNQKKFLKRVNETRIMKGENHKQILGRNSTLSNPVVFLKPNITTY